MFGSYGRWMDHIYGHSTEDITMKELQGRVSIFSISKLIYIYKGFTKPNHEKKMLQDEEK
jgi:hypothetical protein